MMQKSASGAFVICTIYYLLTISFHILPFTTCPLEDLWMTKVAELVKCLQNLLILSSFFYLAKSLKANERHKSSKCNLPRFQLLAQPCTCLKMVCVSINNASSSGWSGPTSPPFWRLQSQEIWTPPRPDLWLHLFHGFMGGRALTIIDASSTSWVPFLCLPSTASRVSWGQENKWDKSPMPYQSAWADRQSKPPEYPRTKSWLSVGGVPFMGRFSEIPGLPHLRSQRKTDVRHMGPWR